MHQWYTILRKGEIQRAISSYVEDSPPEPSDSYGSAMGKLAYCLMAAVRDGDLEIPDAGVPIYLLVGMPEDCGENLAKDVLIDPFSISEEHRGLPR